MSQAALRITGLHLAFGEHRVLRDLDLTVDEGITAVLGPSGCGKSTLLRVVAGFLQPDDGEVLLAGRPVNGRGLKVAPRARSIGYVPQEGALFPHLDVAANIAFGLPRSQRRQAGARVRELLDLVELAPELAHRQPHQLSGGQQQRVALARALMPRPALVLLDEPFSSLDAGLREETGRAVVRAIRASGAAAVLVTHDQGEALSLAGQVAVMDAGRFVQVDTPTRMYVEPRTRTVASFLGHASLVPATMSDAPGDLSATSALGTVRIRPGQEPASRSVTLAVRPEQISVSSVDAPGASGSLGEVIDVSFFGHDATIRIRLEDGTIVVGRTPADAVPAPRTPVRLCVSGEVTAFADEEST